MNKNSTYFIADIGANHDGDIKRAKKLISLAKESGANAVKFQHFKAETIISKAGFSKLGKKSHQSKWSKSVFDIYKDASVPLEWTPELKEHCDSVKVDFFTTPYDLDYVDYLDEFVSIYKIGSGDITWHDLIEKIASKGKPVILSTGASEINEVVMALEILSDNGFPITLMQCNTNYTGDKNNFNYINLNVLKTYSVMFPNVSLGLSDHTPGDITALGAVALGATAIEKHFTDSKKRKGPDHKFAMTPPEWKKMVERVELLEQALGSSVKKIEWNEMETVSLQRRAVRARKNLKVGSKINEENVFPTRPCQKHNGDMPPYAASLNSFKRSWGDNFNMIGKKVTKNIRKGEAIRAEDVRSDR
jgi:N-acetylneuraminate synthase